MRPEKSRLRSFLRATHRYWSREGSLC
jgi:hypothetical protein